MSRHKCHGRSPGIFMCSSGIALHRPLKGTCQLPGASHVKLPLELSKGISLQGGYRATLASVALYCATVATREPQIQHCYMTCRRFHCTTEANPDLLWKSNSPSLSRPTTPRRNNIREIPYRLFQAKIFNCPGFFKEVTDKFPPSHARHLRGAKSPIASVQRTRSTLQAIPRFHVERILYE